MRVLNSNTIFCYKKYEYLLFQKAYSPEFIFISSIFPAVSKLPSPKPRWKKNIKNKNVDMQKGD